MGLSTHVYVRGEVPVLDLFEEGRRLLGCGDAHVWSDEPVPGRKDAKVNDDDPRWIMNDPSQGLPAWLIVRYRHGRAYVTREEADQHTDLCDEDAGEDCDRRYHAQASWMVLNLDTEYGYLGPNWETCGDLHARLVAAIGQWLDARGVAWSWRNEFTGDVHDSYTGLQDLGTGALKATEWMASTVLPAVRASGLCPTPLTTPTREN